MAPTKLERFLAKPELEGTLDEVPGLAEIGIGRLEARGIKTTYQLLAHFLKCSRSDDAMVKFLVDEGGMREQEAKKTAAALKERVANKGFTCNIRLSDHVVKTTITKFTDEKKTAFLQKKLEGVLSDDFFGIRDESKFHAAGIRTTDHLFAAFLNIIDDPNPSANTRACNAFFERLRELGAAPGFKSVIIYQLQAKLAVGIDSHGIDALRRRTALPTLPELDEGACLDEDGFDALNGLEPRGTNERVRTRSAPVSAEARDARRNLRSELGEAPAHVAAATPKQPSLLAWVALPVLLAIGGYWALAGTDGAPLALPKAEAEWL